jgi:hypothetical protein
VNIAFLFFTSLLVGRDPQSGDALVRAMHEKYDGQWYHTLTFVQHNTLYLTADSVQHSTWFERAAIPGSLRIDFREGPGFPANGGALFVRDSQFNIAGDTLVQASPFIHPLMVLGFDVYAQPVERTLAQLRQVGFDLSTTHDDTWQGRPVTVVGAKAGDLHTRQFWVDKERLVFVRMLEPARRDSTATTETQFNDYRLFGKAWVSAQVLFLANGERRWMEEYDQITVNTPLAEGVFDVKRWKDTK